MNFFGVSRKTCIWFLYFSSLCKYNSQLTMRFTAKMALSYILIYLNVFLSFFMKSNIESKLNSIEKKKIFGSSTSQFNLSQMYNEIHNYFILPKLLFLLLNSIFSRKKTMSNKIIVWFTYNENNSFFIEKTGANTQFIPIKLAIE